jgi:hypothetical protein
MQAHTVFSKTSKGQAVFSSMSREVNLRQRSVMIIVDGKRNLDELKKLGAAIGNLEVLLTELQTMGMVEVVAAAPTAVPAAARPAAAGAAPAAAGSAGSLNGSGGSIKDAQRFATRFLNEHMGPFAETHCLRIEKAADKRTLLEHAQRAAESIANIKNTDLANEFLETLEKQLAA